MELAQVVAKVVASVKRVATACALGVIAKIRVLLRRGCVLVLVVAVEVCATLERLGVAAGEEANHGIVASLGARSDKYVLVMLRQYNLDGLKRAKNGRKRRGEESSRYHVRFTRKVLRHGSRGVPLAACGDTLAAVRRSDPSTRHILKLRIHGTARRAGLQSIEGAETCAQHRRGWRGRRKGALVRADVAGKRLRAGQESRILGQEIVELRELCQVVVAVGNLGHHVASRGRGAVERVRGDARTAPGLDWSTLAERMHVLVVGETKQEVTLVLLIVSEMVGRSACAESKKEVVTTWGNLGYQFARWSLSLNKVSEGPTSGSR